MKQIMIKKQESVSKIATTLKSAKSFLFFEYKGITGKQTTKFRNTLYNANAKMYIEKNNILNRALKEAGYNDFAELTGQTALVVANGDEVAPFKELNELIKDAPILKYKDGILESQHVNQSKFVSVASLPNREGLYSMLLSCLTASIGNLARAVNGIAEKK